MSLVHHYNCRSLIIGNQSLWDSSEKLQFQNTLFEIYDQISCSPTGYSYRILRQNFFENFFCGVTFVKPSKIFRRQWIWYVGNMFSVWPYFYSRDCITPLNWNKGFFISTFRVKTCCIFLDGIKLFKSAYVVIKCTSFLRCRILWRTIGVLSKTTGILERNLFFKSQSKLEICLPADLNSSCEITTSSVSSNK